MAVGNIKSRLLDVFTPAAASSDLQIRTRTGGQPTEVPPRSPTQISVQKEVSDIISGSETSADRARAMMHKFAVAPARLIDNGGRRAIGIALRPQHFIGDVLGMNRCHGRRHRATRGGHGGARLSLSSLFCRCAGRADGVLTGLWTWKGSMVPELFGILSEPGCWIAQISAEQWGTAMEDEVAIHVHGFFPLPMGIAREDR
ncbi:hypothetical protein THAOC_26785, partial [Thalassiosira oceanica]